MLTRQASPSRWPPTSALAVIVLLGLALRLWSARGGLWVDEAWSAQFVVQADSAWGIFWRINHDNNHYLNSLWILLVGPYAPPLMIRMLSVVTGTLSIVVAGAIGWRRSPWTGLVAALLFAVSPILVAYGAEARGYGPMLLAVLVSILLIDRWLDRGGAPPAWTLAALTLVGMLAQFTFVFALVAFSGWIVTARGRRGSVDAAVAATVRALGPSLAVLALVIGFVVAAADASSTGFQAGGYPSFTTGAFADVLAETIAYAVGIALPTTGATIVVALATIGALALGASSDRRPLYLFTTIAFPLVLGIVLWRIGNAGFARYYLVAVVGLLLMVADVVGDAVRRGGWRRGVAVVLTLVMVCACLRRDDALATAGRGDPGLAIDAMRSRLPMSASVLVDTIRPIPVLDVAARSTRYPVSIRRRCPGAAFAFVELAPGTYAAASTVRCDRRYVLVQTGRHLALSGIDWALYFRGDPAEKHGGTMR